MDSATQDISPLRRRMIDDMRMRKLADKTRSGYIRVVQPFNFPVQPRAPGCLNAAVEQVRPLAAATARAPASAERAAA